jgi:hypothetical protein
LYNQFYDTNGNSTGIQTTVAGLSADVNTLKETVNGTNGKEGLITTVGKLQDTLTNKSTGLEKQLVDLQSDVQKINITGTIQEEDIDITDIVGGPSSDSKTYDYCYTGRYVLGIQTSLFNKKGETLGTLNKIYMQENDFYQKDFGSF